MTTMLEARSQYFQENHFGADGGYREKWVELALGPVHIAFPNSAARIEAVRFHDLHHLVTGYRTDFVGESEIAAWELAAGCKSMAAAWVLNLQALSVGVFIAPRRIFRAFVRGRRSDTFYAQDFDRLLAATVAEGRTLARLDQADGGRTTLADRALFGATVGIGVALLPLMLALGLVILPFGLAALAAKKARAKAA